MSIGGENIVLSQKIFHRDINILGSWVFFGVGGSRGHSPTLQPWKQVVPAVVSLLQRAAVGIHQRVTRLTPMPRVTGKHSLQPHPLCFRAGEAIPLQLQQERSLTALVAGGLAGDVTGHLQKPFPYAIWKCSGAQRQHPGFAWEILALEADFSGWNLETKASNSVRRAMAFPSFLLASRWWL